MVEKVAAEADQAAYGQLWVKDATPNQLWFTDDGGTDHQLGVGGGGHDADQIIDADGESTCSAATEGGDSADGRQRNDEQLGPHGSAAVFLEAEYLQEVEPGLNVQALGARSVEIGLVRSQ